MTFNRPEHSASPLDARHVAGSSDGTLLLVALECIQGSRFQLNNQSRPPWLMLDDRTESPVLAWQPLRPRIRSAVSACTVKSFMRLRGTACLMIPSECNDVA